MNSSKVIDPSEIDFEKAIRNGGVGRYMIILLAAAEHRKNNKGKSWDQRVSMMKPFRDLADMGTK